MGRKRVERIACRDCGAPGPFSAWSGPRCITCCCIRQKQYRETHPEQVAAKGRRWRETHPEQSAQIAQENYQQRKASGKIDDWKQENREQVNKIAREGYQRRMRDPAQRKAYNARMREYNRRRQEKHE